MLKMKGEVTLKSQSVIQQKTLQYGSLNLELFLIMQKHNNQRKLELFGYTSGYTMGSKVVYTTYLF